MAVTETNSQSSVSELPRQRGQAILSAIIKEHLITGEPVGSKIVAERFANASGLSSATIRNVMSELEDTGFVEQPHTSAGRVPTDKGYRFYVDNLLGVLSLSDKDLGLINQQFGFTVTDQIEKTDNLLGKTSQLLSVLSQNLGIVVSPSLANDRLQHLEFVGLADKKVLVVLVSTPNIVHNKLIRLEENLSQDELDRTARYLNSEFSGKSLLSIRTEILARMHEEKALYDRLLRVAMILCCGSLDGEEDNTAEIYVDGTANLLSNPDFSSVETLRGLLRTIEEKSRLVQILNECIARDHSIKGDVQVVIGRENPSPSMQNCTLITAPYRIGNSSAIGTLSILGPTRIEYARLIAIVSYTARILEQIMSENESFSV